MNTSTKHNGKSVGAKPKAFALPEFVDLGQNGNAKLVFSADRKTAYCLSYDTIIAVVVDPCNPDVYRTLDALTANSARHWRAFCDALNLDPYATTKQYLGLPKAADKNGVRE